MADTPLEIRLVRDYRDLVSLPEVALRVNEMVDDPDCSVHALGKVISQDPALTMRLLGIANSPYYGLARKVENIGQALTLLGLQQVRNLVLASAVSSAFERIPQELITLKDFWRHSLFCGLVAQALGDRRDSRFSTLFTAGLLHDVGQLILFHRYPEPMRQVILQQIEGGAPRDMAEAERRFLDTDHCRVGAALARQWRLPERYIAVIAHHHDAGAAAAEHRAAVALVEIANRIAERHLLPDEAVLEDLPVADAVWEWAGIAPAGVPEALAMAREQIGSLERAYFLG